MKKLINQIGMFFLATLLVLSSCQEELIEKRELIEVKFQSQIERNGENYFLIDRANFDYIFDFSQLENEIIFFDEYFNESMRIVCKKVRNGIDMYIDLSSLNSNVNYPPFGLKDSSGNIQYINLNDIVYETTDNRFGAIFLLAHICCVEAGISNSGWYWEWDCDCISIEL